MKTNIANRWAIVVLTMGSLQMVGHYAASDVLRAIGLASGFAPYPKVFCATRGYEGFTAHFKLTGIRADGSPWSVVLDRERYAKILGPYQRRNVHGAVLAYAPRLPEKMRDLLLADALDANSSLRKELGIPSDIVGMQVHITPREGAAEGPWVFPKNPIDLKENLTPN